MTRDLSDLMARTLDAQEAATGPLAPAADLRARTTRRVRRRRGRRHVVEAAGALGVVAVLAAGSWFGLRPTPTPEPAQTPTQAPAPSAVPTSAGLGQPLAVPVTQDVLDQIGPGWVLSVQQPIYEATGAGRSTGGVEEITDVTVADPMLYLVSPQGEHFAVPADLEVDPGPAGFVALTSWAPGATRVGVVLHADESRTPGWIDLGTGAFTADAAVAPVPDVPDPDHTYKLADAADGVELWELPPDAGGAYGQVYAVSPGTQPRKLLSLEAEGRGLLVDPTGRSFLVPRADGDHDLVTIADGTTRHVRTSVPGKDCRVDAWLDTSTLLMACATPGGEPLDVDFATRRPALYRIDISTQEPELLHEADPDHPITLRHSYDGTRATHVSDGVVAFPGILGTPEASIASTCTDGVYLLAPDGLRVLEQEAPPTVRATRAVAGTVYVEHIFWRPGPSVDPCGGMPGGTLSVTSYDPVTGASVDVLPRPEPAPGVQQWVSSVASWIAQGQ